MNDWLKKLWQSVKRCKIELIIMLAVIAVDLISKQIVESNMELGQAITIVPNFFYITYILNDAAAYGQTFGLEKIVGESGVIVFFIILTVIAIIAFAFFLFKENKRHFMFRFALALIIGGAFGNLVDRISMAAVRDFMQLEVFDRAIFGCFNVADVALVVGVIAFVVYFIFMFDKDEKKMKAEQQVAEADVGEDTETVDAEESTKSIDIEQSQDKDE